MDWEKDLWVEWIKIHWIKRRPQAVDIDFFEGDTTYDIIWIIETATQVDLEIRERIKTKKHRLMLHFYENIIKQIIIFIKD